MSMSAAENKKLKKIGIYGGTFDPVHHAHLILARDALETLALDEVIFVPAAVSPLKKTAPRASGEVRLTMLRAAIEGEPRFAVNECELRRPPPSYTIDTVEEIRRCKSDAAVFCLIGQDNIETLTKWHRFTELAKMVEFVVLDRTAGSRRNHSERETLPGAIEITPENLATTCAELASNKKAEDIVVLDLRGISTFTDFFVICSGTSEPQLKAIANEIETRLREDHSLQPVAIDGFPASQWMVLDYLQVVVHIFHRDKRAFYSLEDLWGDALRIESEKAG